MSTSVTRIASRSTVWTRRACLAAGFAAAVLAALPAPAAAQEWPSRPVRFIVPFAPGAGADIGARLAADLLSKRWNKGVIVENRPGGDSLVAIRAVIAAQDDHMLLFSPSGNFTPHPYKHEKLGYDREKELLPIARFSNTVIGLAVSNSLGVKTMKEFVEKARAARPPMNVVLVPGLTEMVFDNFAKLDNVQMTKVPYTNLVQGANDMGTDRIQASLASLAILQPALQNNVARLLIVTSDKRLPLLPDVPTAREAGFPSIGFDGLVGLFGPRTMPLELRRKIGEDVVAVGNDPSLAEKLRSTGQVPNPGGADEFTADIKRQEEQVAAMAKVLNLARKQ